MHPWLLHDPPIPGYGACLVLGIVCAWLLARGLARRARVEPSHVDILVPLLVAAGFAGAWAFGLWTKQITGAQHGGLVLAGALVGPTLAGIFYARLAFLPLGVLGDLMAAPAALAMAIGRVGCLLAGCCYGDVCTTPWTEGIGLRFPAGSVALAEHVRSGLVPPDAVTTPALLPVQLIEVAGCLVIAWMLWAMAGRRRRGMGVSGELFLTLGVAYGCLRFALEFFRADNPPVWHGLTFTQCAMLAVMAIALIAGWARRRWAEHLGLSIKRGDAGKAPERAPSADLGPQNGDAPRPAGAHP